MKIPAIVAVLVSILVAAATILPPDAEAARFGGGRSMGRQSHSMPRAPQPAPQYQAPNRPVQSARLGAGGGSRWLGPLAGLAAGGLLASLFFGDSFQGMQMLDFLLIALLIGGGIYAFRVLKRSQAPRARAANSGAPAPATGSAGPEARAPWPEPAQAPQRAGGSPPLSLGASPPQPGGADRFPYWFDGPAFLEGAKSHFLRLQSAWDRADFPEIRDYTTPSLFAELQRERERLGGTQHTEVVRLQTELVTIQQEGDTAVASIRFHGLIRESEEGVANPFDEVWHIQHRWDSPDGEWRIAGIQQLEGSPD